jgi:tyrosinase
VARLSPAVAVFLCLLVFAPGALAQDDTWIRKDVKDLTAQEKKDFVDAIYKLKRTRSPYGKRKISYYDFLVYYHRRASNDLENGNGAHMGPAFLPWHREFLNAFEALLTNISGKHITVPYWDWTNPASTQALLSDDFMGGAGDPKDRYAVKTGPFRKGRWELKLRDNPGQRNPLKPNIDDAVDRPYIQRAIGRDPIARTLPTPDETAAIVGVKRYDSKPWSADTNPKRSFRCAIEGWARVDGAEGIGGHNQVHMWVGGSFGSKRRPQIGTIGDATSPNDPIFWLLHANADRLWTEWQLENGRRNYRPEKGATFGHNLRDPLSQFAELGFGLTQEDVGNVKALRPIDLLDNRKLFVQYQQPLAEGQPPVLIQ